MNSRSGGKNRRVLVIDDNLAIHDDFRKILSPRTAAPLDATEAAVFGQSPDAARRIRFHLFTTWARADCRTRFRN